VQQQWLMIRVLVSRRIFPICSLLRSIEGGVFWGLYENISSDFRDVVG
jgi:hypothetical protein